jgi:flagellar FliL protein
MVAGGFLGYRLVAGRRAPVDGQAADPPITLGPVFQFQPFIVNVAESGARRYLKCTMSMELSSAAGIQEAQEKAALLRDVVIDVLSSKRLADLEAGPPRDALRKELADTLNSLISRAQVERILFSEFVLQ